ncbi:MAG: hypothetical protein SF069_04615 [Phycisphaerae bacterium]|nr:hypothetical protein [Phycisphaerae bacterium]
MRGATEAAKRVKKVFASLKSSLGKVPRLPVADPITQLLLGVFSRSLPETKAREIVDHLRSLVVDYNELRVIPPHELAAELSGIPDAYRKCEDVSRAFNAIFAIEHSVSLDRVKGLPKRDMVAYLEKVPGLEPYTRARIRLLGFEQPAAPLDEAMWAYGRAEEFIDPKCDLEEAQAFLERTLSDDDLPDFVALLKRQAWSDYGSAVKKGQTARIASIAPDRKSTNMLLEVAGGQVPDDEPELDEVPDPELAEAEEGSSKKRGRKGEGKGGAKGKSGGASEATKREKSRPKAEKPEKADKAEKPEKAEKAAGKPAKKPAKAAAAAEGAKPVVEAAKPASGGERSAERKRKTKSA